MNLTLNAKKRVKKEYGLDIIPVGAGSGEEQKWLEFFSRVNIKWCRRFGWPADSAKGIVRVAL